MLGSVDPGVWSGAINIQNKHIPLNVAFGSTLMCWFWIMETTWTNSNYNGHLVRKLLLAAGFMQVWDSEDGTHGYCLLLHHLRCGALAKLGLLARSSVEASGQSFHHLKIHQTAACLFKLGWGTASRSVILLRSHSHQDYSVDEGVATDKRIWIMSFSVG